MKSFGNKKPHHDVDRLMFHFDAADKNKDNLITPDEIDAYAAPMESKDPGA